MTIDGFMPLAAIIGGAIVGAVLVYTIFYGFHMKVLGDYGSWWVWPLLALYAVGAVIGLIGMARTYWAGTAPHYGFYGDDPYIHEAAHVGPWPLYSFALLFLLSCLLLISARHAAATKNSAKAKT